MLQTRLLSAAFRPRPLVTTVTFRMNALHTRASANKNAFFRTGLLASSIKAVPKNKAAFVAGSPVLMALRRTITTDADVVTPASKSEAWKRLGVAAAVVLGAAVGTNAILNRETRDALSTAERSYLNESFRYMGGGLAIVAATARLMFKNGFAVRVMSANPSERSYLNESFRYMGGGLAIVAAATRLVFKNGFAIRVMSANPWAVLGLSLVGGIGTILGVFYTPPENTLLKHTFWIGFNVCQAATLSPLFFFNPAILSRAALYTAGVIGSLAYATANNDTYLYMGGPLLAGLTVVALSSLAPLALPLDVRGLAIAEAISLYGGLAVFSGFVLFDTQKILAHTRAAEAGLLESPLL
ncbi:hypothetical protein A7U60_g5869 [Sanghuangporus baumii]|uniref:Uncharacterized protein n=1 Tax=Sanghuangporus baumii TaxID=108892 RepID=A0A9Q5HW70_SANBA|nr:hypothetical protein A7U60_g5869 [Sanghuangporus baumii]